MPHDHPSDDSLARFLAGESPADERAAVERWAASSPRHREELEALRAVWRPTAAGGWDPDRAWQRVRVEVGGAPVVGRLPVARPTRRIGLAMAAMLLLAFGVAIGWQALRPAAAIDRATGPGETLEVALGDGSTVVLAPRSTLHIPGGYGRRERRVELEGEAWFEVHHDAERRFVVHIAGREVEDIGTSFTLRSRDPDSLDVAVIEGEVAVRSPGTPGARQLRAGDVARFAPERDEIAHHQAVAAPAGWREARLEFTAVPASRVAARLGEWFGERVWIADPSVAARPVSVTFPRGSLDDAIDVLDLLLGTTAERGDSGLVLR